MKVLVLLLLFVAVGPSSAATLVKCVGADGVASYQSQPCAAGERTAWTREAPTVADPPPRPARPAETRPKPTIAARSASVRRPANTSATRCAAARRSADLTRDRLWNRLSFRQRSDLDAKVAQACVKR